MEHRIDCNSNVKHIELDFGEVEVGITEIKSIKIVNQCSTRQSYVVERDPTSNPLDNVYDTVEYAWSLCPCQSYVCDISFKPALPNRKYIDYFFITDTYKCCYKIVVRGYSVGPKVTSSKTRLVMMCKNKPCAEERQCKSEKCLKLTNHVNVPAKFLFDIDTTQCPFKINESRGVIKALTSKCFTITFEPPAAGIYKYYMPCLILNQEPIILELYGLCGCDLSQEQIDAVRKKIEMVDELDLSDTFQTYMNDVTNLVKYDPPPVSLSSSFIDFGLAEIGRKNCGKTPLTVSLTNHNKYNLLVIWETDCSGVFSIQPREAKLRSDQSIDFEVRFNPTEPRSFYARELLARLFRLPCCSSNDDINVSELAIEVVPDFVTIRLIGHTYDHGCNDWMPQYAIPETVVLPACLPASPVYTIFALKNFGQQPLMFNFIPPDTMTVNHYSIKPRVGVVCP